MISITFSAASLNPVCFR